MPEVDISNAAFNKVFKQTTRLTRTVGVLASLLSATRPDTSKLTIRDAQKECQRLNAKAQRLLARFASRLLDDFKAKDPASLSAKVLEETKVEVDALLPVPEIVLSLPAISRSSLDERVSTIQKYYAKHGWGVQWEYCQDRPSRRHVAEIEIRLRCW